VSIRYTIDTRALGRVGTVIRAEQRRINPELRVVVQSIMLQAKSGMIAATPRAQEDPFAPGPTTHARDQWHYRTDQTGAGMLFNSAPYTPFLFTGTTAHFIAPLNAQALRFGGGGGVPAFSKGHMVGGIRPNDKMVTTLASMAPLAERELKVAGLKATVHMHNAIKAVSVP
jgi:hypothetical protein